MPQGSFKAVVVDDSSAIRLLLRSMLEKAGFEVLDAPNGRDALSLMAEQSISLALVDWNMPEMSGMELLQRMRNNPELNDAKIMMVTTETELDHVRRALLVGADEYVMKPFTEEIITDKLRLLGF